MKDNIDRKKSCHAAINLYSQIRKTEKARAKRFSTAIVAITEMEGKVGM